MCVPYVCLECYTQSHTHNGHIKSRVEQVVRLHKKKQQNTQQKSRYRFSIVQIPFRSDRIRREQINIYFIVKQNINKKTKKKKSKKTITRSPNACVFVIARSYNALHISVVYYVCPCVCDLYSCRYSGSAPAL